MRLTPSSRNACSKQKLFRQLSGPRRIGIERRAETMGRCQALGDGFGQHGQDAVNVFSLRGITDDLLSSFEAN